MEKDSKKSNRVKCSGMHPVDVECHRDSDDIYHHDTDCNNNVKPNFLFILVDEMRYPPGYETDAIKKWRKNNLNAQNYLRKKGFEFTNHRTSATACAPSRATLFTGQYESLHGVTQTDGAAKSAFDPDMFWLDPNTVPHMGTYFAEAGYGTHWIGKWHESEEDILIPGTKNALPSYNPLTGVPDKTITNIYKKANKLKKYGWNGWVGPDPHGQAPRNSASSAASGVSGRDVVYTEDVIDLIDQLDKTDDDKPFFIVASLVNPHDITLYGDLTRSSPSFDFKIDPSVPLIDPTYCPTYNEDLSTKPSCQADYQTKYQIGFQLTASTPDFLQFYYSLNLTVDRNIERILKSLDKSKFRDNTIVIFTSDHGDLLGSHGMLFQKWYTAYEEEIHVPLIVKLPKSIQKISGSKKGQSSDMLTCSVDILPTLLGLAGIDEKSIEKKLEKSHTEVHRLVGRDLSKLILGTGDILRANEPILFVTNDDVLTGSNQLSFAGTPYQSVIEPNSIQCIVVKNKATNGKVYKFSRYYDSPQFWSTPGYKDVTSVQQGPAVPSGINQTTVTSTVTTKYVPVADQYEMYNITDDPYEQKNLVNPTYATIQSTLLQSFLLNILQQQVALKCLTPTHGMVPGQDNTISQPTSSGAVPS